jgi:hypothetical protein
MKISLSTLFFITFSISAFAQSENHSVEKTRTTNKGVTVYRSLGVEKSELKSENKNSVVENRTFEDWSIEECRDALYYVEKKHEKAISENNTNTSRYSEEINKLKSRITYLESNQ